MLRVKSPQDFGAGVFFMLFGFAGIFFARDLAFGSTEHMGPGYFPVILSAAIALVGVVIALRALAVDGPTIERFAWRPLLFVLASILLFTFLIAQAGLVITTAAMTIVVAYARPNTKLVETLIFSAALAIFAVILFVYALGQPMPIWWS
jgi:hypothetical protein